ncbi:hypothetical protein RRF57_013411 [Xylaria bambusicola]|uniref:Uncharacterized protein n=1 Tax=Xylaria bambusicola TaxID=326684 RepID=A0AAN7V2T4_9PEZI
MTTMMTTQLTKEDVERRVKVRVAAGKTMPGAERDGAFRKIVQTAENGTVTRLLGQKELPFVSAAYLNWVVDNRIWMNLGMVTTSIYSISSIWYANIIH